MRQLSFEPPSPRPRRPAPRYPRALPLGLLAVLGACGGAVDDRQGASAELAPPDDSPDAHADAAPPPVTPPNTIDGGAGGAGGDPILGGGEPAPWDAQPPPPPLDAGATIDAAPDADPNLAGDVASPFDAGLPCEAGPHIP